MYDRKKAVEYALKWASDRNPIYYNYDKIGGDCTNYISQCLYAGIGEMNYRKNSWFYKDANKKSPSWTGVEFLYKFLINNKYEGPKGEIIEVGDIDIGDIIQLSFNGNIFAHTLIVSDASNGIIRVCAHTVDSKNRELSSYKYSNIRCIKIEA